MTPPVRTYAVGDIHGHLDKLHAAHALIEADRRRVGEDGVGDGGGPDAAPVVHVGDLVDRGPDARGVIEHLRAGIEGGAPWIVLRGNHDQMFLDYLASGGPDGAPEAARWLNGNLGGTATLESYGVTKKMFDTRTSLIRRAAEAVPEAHVAFLSALPYMHLTDEVIFVHAGIRPGVPLEQQIEVDMLWIRAGFLDDPTDHGRLVVHGHTAMNEVTHFGNRVDIDGGAAYGRPLVPVVIEGRKVWTLTEAGRIPLVAPPGA